MTNFGGYVNAARGIYYSIHIAHVYLYMYVQNFCTYYSFHNISIATSTLKIQIACPYCSVNYTPWCVYTNTHCVDSQRLYSKRNMVHGTLLPHLMSTQQPTPTHVPWALGIGQPYARFNLNPMPESTLSPSQEPRIRPLDTLLYQYIPELVRMPYIAVNNIPCDV